MNLFSHLTARLKLAILIIALALLILGEVVYRHLAGRGWSDLADAPPHAEIQALAAAPDGTLWAGSPYSLAQFDAHSDGQAWTRYTQRDGMPGDDVSAITIAPDGDMWLRLDGTCAHYDGQSWERCRKLDLLIADASGETRPILDRAADSWSVAAAPDGVLWFGTTGGVLRDTEYQVPRQSFPYWQVYDAGDGLPDDRVLSIAAGPDGEVWAGTARGAARYDGETWTVYTQRDGLAHEAVRSMAVAPDGAVWFATRRGLLRLAPPAARTATGRDWLTVPYAPGMPRTPSALAVDAQGHLWAGTPDGIAVWDARGAFPSWALNLWRLPRAILTGTILALGLLLIVEGPWGYRYTKRIGDWTHAQAQRLAGFSPRAAFLGWAERARARWLQARARLGQAVSRQRGLMLGLSLVVLFGLVLRLWRLDYGQMLPYVAHADEQTQYNPAIHIIQTGDLNPRFFNYPSLTIYLDTLALYAGYQVGSWIGAYEAVSDLQPIRTVGYGRGWVGTPELLLLGRATTALFGTLTLFVLWLLSRPLVRARWTALIPVLILALNREHVRLSHYMTVDVIATFFATACIAGCTLYLARRDRRFLWAAALCGGLSTASKYNYVVLAIPVGLSPLLDPRLWLGQQLKRVLACGLIFCLAFLLASPYILLDFEAAMEDITFEVEHYSTGHLGQTGASFPSYARMLWDSNPFLLLLGIPGWVLALWRRKRVAVPVAIFSGLYFALIGVQAVHMGRNALPLIVLLGAGAGAAVDAALALLPARVRNWQVGLRGVRLSPLAVALACIPLLPALSDLPALLQLPRPSGQAQAQAWLDQALSTSPERDSSQGGNELRIAAKLRIAAEGYTIYLDPQQHDITYLDTVTKVGPPGTFRSEGYDIVLLGSGMFGRFYGDRQAFAEEIRIYDAFFRLSDRMVFAGPDDPLSFVGSDARVHIFFLTDRARQFRAGVEAALSSPSAQGRPAGPMG